METHANPFAIVVLAHLKAQETARDPDARYAWKGRLARGLYHRGWSRQDVFELFRFLNGVRGLPEAVEDRLWAELPQYEEQQVMALCDERGANRD